MTKPLDATGPTGNLGKISTQETTEARLKSDLANVLTSSQAAIREAVYKTVRECAEITGSITEALDEDEIGGKIYRAFERKWPEAFK